MKKHFLSILAITMMIATTIQAQVPTNGLVAYYPFSGNANDSSGNGNNGTVNNATLTTDRFGNANSAYRYDGATSYINIPNSNSLKFNGQLTISVWVNAVSLPSPLSYILSKGGDGGTPNSWCFPVESNGLVELSVYDNTGNKNNQCNSTANAVVVNNWVNITSTFDGSTTKIFINGVMNNSVLSNYTTFSNNYDLKFGRRYISGLPYFFNGKIDDARIYSRALDSTEIQSLYHEGGYGIKKTNITSFSPTTASTGKTVTIKGISFTGATSVTFGAYAATSFKVLNDSTITAVIGIGKSGNVVVVSPNGTAILGGFVYYANTGIPTNGLVAWYPFSGNAIDSSGNGNNGTVNGASLTTDRFGNANSAYKFNGTSDYINCGTKFPFSSFTYSGWLNLNSYPTTYFYEIVSKLHNQGYVYVVDSPYYCFQNAELSVFSDSILSGQTGSGITWVGPNVIKGINNRDLKLKLNTWYLATYTYDYNKKLAKIYLNNKLIDTGNYAYSDVPNISLYIGARATGAGAISFPQNPGFFFDGKLDDIFIYNRAIDSLEVQELYQVGGYALPVSIENMSVTYDNKLITVNWQSALELNTANFIIQHSTNGISFTDIGTVKAIGGGANSYGFTDNNPANGINYYRLQSIDKDGSSSYSKVVSVNFGNNQSFSIVPNPAKDFATISFNKAVDKATIAVYDITGKQVIKQSLNGSANNYKLNTQSLKSGLYVIKVNTATGNYNEKLLINK